MCTYENHNVSIQQVSAQCIHTITYTYDNVYQIVCSRGHAEIVKLMVEAEGYKHDVINRMRNCRPYVSAAKNGHADVIEVFLSITNEHRQVDDTYEAMRGAFGFVCACSDGNMEMFELLLGLEDDLYVNEKLKSVIFNIFKY